MNSLNISSAEGVCPNCSGVLKYESPNHYRCKLCHNGYREEIHCLECNDIVKTVSGCGAVNFICPVHGLISSKSVIFYYFAN